MHFHIEAHMPQNFVWQYIEHQVGFHEQVAAIAMPCLMLQVKIRGMRIELGEIESVLASHPGIQDVVASVVMHEATQQPVVVAHATQADLDVEAILETSRAKLPEYMIPDMVLPVESMDAVPPQEYYEDMPLLLSERGLSGEASPYTNPTPHKLSSLPLNVQP